MPVTWIITGLTVSQVPQPNTVTDIEYSASAGSATRSGRVTLSAPGETFTTFEDLTPEVVLGWLWEYVSKDATEAVLEGEARKASAPLPWASGDVQE